MQDFYTKAVRRIFAAAVLCLLSVSVSTVFGQSKSVTITGTVYDEANMPAIGASVLEKNTVNGVATDVNGRYSIKLENPNGVLEFSYLGYATQDVSVAGRTEIDVVLQPDNNIEEVVVVGYGVQKKESVVGAISTVDVSNLKTSSAQLSTSLAGQLAGVVSMTRSGEPGKSGAADFYIRGVSSFTGSTTPLVLVDGIERDIDLVDTDDIESFSILKDASASAVYGVRGANGVILITTKKGKEGRPEVKIRAEGGMTQSTRRPTFSNAEQWARMYNEALGRSYYNEDALAAYREQTDPDLYPDVDWINTLFKDFAFNERVNASISGGGQVARYYISGSFYNESSIFRNAGDIYGYNSSINYNKFNFRANVDMNLTKTTVLNVNLSNIYEKSFAPGASKGDIWGYAFMTAPNAFPVEYSDGTISAPSTNSGFNPWNLLVHSGYQEQFWNSAQSLIGLTQDFGFLTEGLTANIKFSWDAWNTQTQTRTKTPEQFHAKGRDAEGNLIYGTPIYPGSETLAYGGSASSEITTYLEGSINYNRMFANAHRVGAMFLYNHKIRRVAFGGDATTSLPYKNQGIAARVTYAYRDKYMVEFNMGYNGSENFAPGHRFGFFPAVSGGWLISEESFWKPVKDYISTLKLRASYGKVGNDNIGGARWLYLSTILEGGGNSYTMGSTGANGGSGIAMGRQENLAFSWEEETKLDAGIELTLFNSLRIQADYFDSHRTGILMQRSSLPGYAGLQNSAKLPYVNIGETRNRGVDMSLEWNQQFGDWYLTARGTFTYNRNTLLNNDEPNWEYLYENRIGKPYGLSASQPWGLKAIGLFQSQEEIDNSPVQTFGEYRVGDIKYQDINGDGIIDTHDRVYLGYTTIPEITYGFGATVSWKGLDVNVFFQGIGNVSFFISGNSLRPDWSNFERQAIQKEVWDYGWRLDRTAAENANAQYPRLATSGQAGSSNNSQTSSWWQRNGSFMRLKNVEVGYTFPKRWMSKTGFMKSLRIYALITNGLTFSEFKMWDPEQGGGSGSGYPPNRVYSIGLNLNL